MTEFKRGTFVVIKKGNLIYKDLITEYNNQLWLIQSHDYLKNLISHVI
jgi:hypothetical protein